MWKYVTNSSLLQHACDILVLNFSMKMFSKYIFLLQHSWHLMLAKNYLISFYVPSIYHEALPLSINLCVVRVTFRQEEYTIAHERMIPARMIEYEGADVMRLISSSQTAYDVIIQNLWNRLRLWFLFHSSEQMSYRWVVAALAKLGLGLILIFTEHIYLFY